MRIWSCVITLVIMGCTSNLADRAATPVAVEVSLETRKPDFSPGSVTTIDFTSVTPVQHLELPAHLPTCDQGNYTVAAGGTGVFWLSEVSLDYDMYLAYDYAKVRVKDSGFFALWIETRGPGWVCKSWIRDTNDPNVVIVDMSNNAGGVELHFTFTEHGLPRVVRAHPSGSVTRFDFVNTRITRL